MKSQDLWKIAVDAPLSLDQIERAVAELPVAVDRASPTQGVELQRIDITAGKSVVFVTGSRESAQAFGSRLKARNKKARARCVKASAKEVRADAPAKA